MPPHFLRMDWGGHPSSRPRQGIANSWIRRYNRLNSAAVLDPGAGRWCVAARRQGHCEREGGEGCCMTPIRIRR